MDFDTLFLRFDHIAESIFEDFDEETLLDCRRVCRSWNTFLNESRFWRKRWEEKLDKVLFFKPPKPYFSSLEPKTLLDEFPHIKDYYIHFYESDVTFPSIQILVNGLKKAIVPGRRKRRGVAEFKLVDPLHQACNNGNVGFIKLIIESPLKHWRYDINYLLAERMIMSNTETTKYFLDNLEQFDIDLENYKGIPFFHYAAVNVFGKDGSDVSARCLKLIFDKSVEKNIDVKAKFDYDADYEIAQKPNLKWRRSGRGGPVHFPKKYETEKLYENIYEKVLRLAVNPPSLVFLELWKDFGIELTPWTFNKLSKNFVQRIVVEIYYKMSFKWMNEVTAYPGGEIDRLLEYPETCYNGRLYQKKIEHLGKGVLMKVIVEYLKILSGDKECPKLLERREKYRIQEEMSAKKRRLY